MVRIHSPVLAVWIVAWATTADGGKVTKCCGRDAILKIDLRSCMDYSVEEDDRATRRESYDHLSSLQSTDNRTSGGADADSSADNRSVPWWIPDNLDFLRASNQSETFEPGDGSFDDNGRFPCGADDREASLFDDDVAVLDDGRLVMFGQDVATNTSGERQRLTFSAAEYCIDRVSLGVATNDTGVDGEDDQDDGRTDSLLRRRRAGAEANATVPYQTYTYVVLVCRPCSRITCVPKCCAKGVILEYRKNAGTGCRKDGRSVDAADAVVQLKSANGTRLQRDDYYFFRMKPPDCGDRSWYILNKPTGNATINYGLLPDGRVQVDNGLVPIERDEYCVDTMLVVPDDASPEASAAAAAADGPRYTDVLLACRLQTPAAAEPLEFREILYGAYFVVGTAFLAATLLIYAALPELRVTVHSGNLIAHTVCLFVSYATLAATTLVRHAFNYCACIVAGFVIQFSFLAAFFWLNVMCADIAWTFSEFKLLLYSNKIENEKKKFIIYSVYAWSCSIGITILTAVAEFTNLFGELLKPHFGDKTCWFYNKFSVGVFFYLPIGLLLLTNFILFLFTAYRIIFIRRDTSKVLNRQTNQNNMRLSLYLKLFCLMGVTFVFELISWAVKAPDYYWYVTDAVNSLRGVFVFFIFCWKRSVLNLLLARAPDSARNWFVRTFDVREPHRYPSFSSSCQPHNLGRNATSISCIRTNSVSTTTHNNNGSSRAGSRHGCGSLQLSQFGSSASMVTGSARRNSSVRQQ